MLARRRLPLLLLPLVALFASCMVGQTARYTSNVVDYLYPEGAEAQVPSIPHLSLPLKVGVAFVPGEESYYAPHSITEQQKMELSERIAAEFRDLEFVEHIELIPSAYLSAGGGFTNLDQIQAMYGVDVMALISYDQVQHTDEDWLSLSYWSIVGMYVIEGEENDTSTMVDAAVFDIKSRKLLFRAPGLSHVEGTATPINQSEQLRLDSLEGLQLASDDLVLKLRGELIRFQERVKDAPEEYVIEHEPGYVGGGSTGGAFALAVLVLGAAASLVGRGAVRS